MACLTVLICWRLGFRLIPARAVLPGLGLLLLAAALAWGRARGWPRLVLGARAFLQMTLFTIIAVALSYALAAQGAPLWDEAFAAADLRLGFGWPAFFAQADLMPGALWVGGIAYHSLSAQMVACVVALAAAGRADRLREMVAAAVASGFVTVAVSGAMPAMGNVFDPAGYRHLWPSVAWTEQAMLAGLRDGTWRTLDPMQLMGIVTFPSYHATLPVILAWSVRDMPRWRVAAPVWAGITILATPLFGGHYGVDVLVGLALAVAALRFAPALVRHRPGRARILPPAHAALARG